MTQQGRRQAALRLATGLSETYDGDWHAAFDQAGIDQGPFEGRFIKWVNTQLGVSTDNFPEAAQLLADAAEAFNFSSMGDFTASGGPWPQGTRSVVWLGDANSYGDKMAPNLLVATEPTDNIHTYAGMWRNQGSGPTITPNYDGAGGTRVQFNAAQSFTIISANAPGGTSLHGQSATIGFGLKPTSGVQAIRFGQSANLGELTVSGSDFTQASKTWTFVSTSAVTLSTQANFTIAAAPTGAVRVSNVATFTTTAAHKKAVGQVITITSVTDTTFNGTYTVLSVPSSTTVTVANAGTDATSGSGTMGAPVDIVLQPNLQIYAGTSLPNWETENWNYHVKATWALPNAFSMDAQAANNVSPAVARGVMLFPAYMAITECTIFLIVEKSSTTVGANFCAPIYDPDHSPTVSSTTLSMSMEATTGEYFVNPQSNTRSAGFFYLPSQGVQILGLRKDDYGTQGFVNEVRCLQTDPGSFPWAGMSSYGLWFMCSGSTRNQQPTTALADGKLYGVLFATRAFTDEEVTQTCALIRGELASRGVSSVGDIQDWTITPGDSLTQWLSAPTWPWVMANDRTIVPPFQLVNAAHGGTSFHQSPAPVGNGLSFQEVLADDVIPALEGCTAGGINAILMFMDGANDADYLATLVGEEPPNPVAGWDTGKTGWENYRDIWWIPYMQAVRATKADTKIIAIDTLPRDDAFAQNCDFETEGRVPWNTWKRANYATYCDDYVSFAGTSLDTIAAVDLAGYFSLDRIHYVTAGQAYLKTVVQPIWLANR